MTTTDAKKKKVLHVITKSNWGGAQRHVYDLAVHTPKKEFDVAVTCGGNGPLFKKLEEAGVRTFPLINLKRDLSFVSDLLSFFELLEIIKNERPDILHLHSSKAGGLGALAGRIMRVPKIVYTAHGWPFKEDRKAWQKRAIYIFSWLTSALSDRVIAVSKDDEKRAPAYFVRGKTRMIYPGLGKNRHAGKSEARKEICRLAGISQAEGELGIVVGVLAELHKNKGLPYLLEAVRHINLDRRSEKPVRLFILGEGEERENLLKLSEQPGLKDRVFLLGQVENAPEWLKAFDIFVLPSVKEGLPYTVLEAGMAELPVVATAVGGVPEVVEDMSSGLVVRPKDAKDLEQALRFVINNPEKAKSFGEKLRQKIENDFSLEKMIKEIVNVYNF